MGKFHGQRAFHGGLRLIPTLQSQWENNQIELSYHVSIISDLKCDPRILGPVTGILGEYYEKSLVGEDECLFGFLSFLIQ